MKKPLGIKIISGIIYFRIALMVLVIILFISSSTIFYKNEIWQGIRDGILTKAGMGKGTSVTAYEYGCIIGSFLGPTILLMLNLIYLKKRNYKGLKIVSIIMTITSFGNAFNLISSAVLLLIIFLNPETIIYFQNVETNNPIDENCITNSDN